MNNTPPRAGEAVRAALVAMMPKLENPSCHTPDIDPELFFPESLEEYVQTREMIRKICAACPDREPCLTFALDNQVPHGIWGGLNHVERSRLTNKIPNTNQAREILYQLRALMRRGLTVKQACSDLGISVRTYERYRIWEKSDWQERQQRNYVKSQLEKGNT